MDKIRSTDGYLTKDKPVKEDDVSVIEEMKIPHIEGRVISYLWPNLPPDAREYVRSVHFGGEDWNAMAGTLEAAANLRLFVPEKLLAEAEEAAMEFIDFNHGSYAYFVLDPIEDIRANNAKLLAEGKIPA